MKCGIYTGVAVFSMKVLNVSELILRYPGQAVDVLRQLMNSRDSKTVYEIFSFEESGLSRLGSDTACSGGIYCVKVVFCIQEIVNKNILRLFRSQECKLASGFCVPASTYASLSSS